MLSNLNYLLVSATCFVCICKAIRVDWNTNTGPIIPPTPRTTIRPVPPFREPAPVWEDLTNDIRNPNPYIYVPPPPSRPKQRLNTNINYNNNNYGTIVTSQNAAAYYQQNNNSPQVASLSTQYIPNVGNRYIAVVPTISTTTTTKATKPTLSSKYPQQTSLVNGLSPDDKTSYKLQGKYNIKTKKYKAYEKVKYVPLNYASDTTPQATTQIQQLPLEEINIKFNTTQQTIPTNDSLNKTNLITTQATVGTSNTPYTTHVYPKDAKVKFQEDKTNKKS